MSEIDNNFCIQTAKKIDATAIHEMIQVFKKKKKLNLYKKLKELADFEKMPNGPEIGVEQLGKDIDLGRVHVLICYNNQKKAVAMNLYYYAYSTWQGQVS